LQKIGHHGGATVQVTPAVARTRIGFNGGRIQIRRKRRAQVRIKIGRDFKHGGFLVVIKTLAAFFAEKH
jgi:hypothetical protein